MSNKYFYGTLLASVLFFVIGSAYARGYRTERIEEFASHVVLNVDGSATITEKITVNATGESIRFGITREIPTDYSQSFFWFPVYFHQPFEVISVMRNGVEEPYTMKKIENGWVLYIGRERQFVPVGLHTYTIAYTLGDVVGFFEDHDEFVWNVTGHDWRMPIIKAMGAIVFPFSMNKEKFSVEMYTGTVGSHVSKADVSWSDDRTLQAVSSVALRKGMGFTVATGFDKGIFIAPTIFQKSYHFARDNWIALLLLLGALFLFFFYLFKVYKQRIIAKRYTIIPLFHQPKDFSPGECRYIDRWRVDSTTLTSEVVGLAVRGFLTISSEKKAGWLSTSTTYTLEKKEEPLATPTRHEERLLRRLFPVASNKIVLESGKGGGIAVTSALSYCDEEFRSSFKQYKDDFPSWRSVTTVFPIVAFALSFIKLGPPVLLLFVPYVILWLLLVLFYDFRSDEGRKIAAEVAGFKEFLSVAEKDRIALAGTPPERTPELYERYLPYAIALGVEKAWTEQFAPIFEKLSMSGTPYIMPWYHGPLFAHGMGMTSAMNEFTQMGSSLSRAISSVTVSQNAPGTRSVFGKGGSSRSGGGGVGSGSGGGGGGGW